MAEETRSKLWLLPARHVQMTAEEEAAAIEAVAALLGMLPDRPGGVVDDSRTLEVSSVLPSGEHESPRRRRR